MFILKARITSDKLSRLIDIDPDIVVRKDYEFGCYYFETLPKVKSTSVREKLASVNDVDICEISITFDNPENSQFSIKLPLSNEKFACLCDKDVNIQQL